MVSLPNNKLEQLDHHGLKYDGMTCLMPKLIALLEHLSIQICIKRLSFLEKYPTKTMGGKNRANMVYYILRQI